MSQLVSRRVSQQVQRSALRLSKQRISSPIAVNVVSTTRSLVTAPRPVTVKRVPCHNWLSKSKASQQLFYPLSFSLWLMNGCIDVDSC